MELFKLLGTIAIDASGATQTIDATIDASEELAEMLGNISKKADDAGDKMNRRSRIGTAAVWLGNTLHSLTSRLGHFTASVIKSGLDFNANMESYQAQFAALLQNTEQAQELVAEIQELAKISPLGMEGLAENAVQLLSAGTELTEILPTLEMLGNLSLGDSTKMDYVVTAYQQIMNTGKLKAQEIYQLINAGVPIIRLLTEYGGEKFADGTWYQAYLNDPKEFYVTAEEVHNAMKAATAEGGDYYNYMFKMMDTYKGQLDRLGEEGKESIGKFMKPFNDVLSSKVFPKISELFGSFGTWASENTEAIGVFAEALGDFAVWALQGLIDGFKYLVENGPELVKTIKDIVDSILPALQTLGSWFGFGTKDNQGDYVANALANADKTAYQKYAGKYTGLTEDQRDAAWYYALAAAGNHNTAPELQALRDAGLDDAAVIAIQEDVSAALASGEYTADNIHALFEPAAEADLQKQLDGYDLEVDVKLNLGGFANRIGNFFNLFGGNQAEGSHASGLRYVPHDNYLANLHLGETVLPRNEADAYRRGGNVDNSILVNAINALSDRVYGIMQQVAINTGMGQTIVLDSGAVVGQTVRQMDTQLGAIATRKGRRN